MKICIDGIGVNLLAGTGLYSYTYELLNNLLQMYPQPVYQLIWENVPFIREWEKHKNLCFSSIGLNRKENDYTLLEKHITENKIDVYHSPNNGLSLPLKKLCKYVITVHDLVPLSFRHLTDQNYLKKFISVFPTSIAKSDKILADSEFIKKEILTYFSVPEEKIEVVYPGCARMFTPLDGDNCKQVLKSKYGIKNDFILYAGSIHPRKKLDTLVKAFKELTKTKMEMDFVIVGKLDGKRESHYLKIKDLSEQLNIQDCIVFTGTVDYKDMVYFYNSCLSFVNISDYEGYPMTAVEASACGCPVICSKSSCFKEVLGSSPIFTDNDDVNTLKDILLETIYTRKNEASTIKKANKRVEIPSWETYITKLVRVYESTVYG